MTERYLSVVDELPIAEELPLDGYDVPFDPERHLLHLREAQIAEYSDPCNTGHIDSDQPTKDKPAGWWDKEGRSGV